MWRLVFASLIYVMLSAQISGDRRDKQPIYNTTSINYHYDIQILEPHQKYI